MMIMMTVAADSKSGRDFYPPFTLAVALALALALALGLGHEAESRVS